MVMVPEMVPEMVVKNPFFVGFRTKKIYSTFIGAPKKILVGF